MKYRITGSSRETGARMILEFEAESKAAAERKALQQGMNVNTVQDITDGDTPHALPPRSSGAALRPRSGSLAGKLIKLIVLLVILYFAYRYARPYIRV